MEEKEEDTRQVPWSLKR